MNSAAEIARNLKLIVQLERAYAMLGLDAPVGAANTWNQDQVNT
jgi:hypothetical protein